MVGLKSKIWVQEPPEKKKKNSKLGILGFEAAKTMSSLVSLYKSLSDEAIGSLQNGVIKTQGVVYLNSRDEGFLLSLAAAERLEDLDRAAAAVSRLLSKSNAHLRVLNWFDILYHDLKMGTGDFRKLEYGSRVANKLVQKMENLVSTTSLLRSSLEDLTELEISQRKHKDNSDLFHQKLEKQRTKVENFREMSLWNKKIGKIADLMANIVLVVYKRMCLVFGKQKIFSLNNVKILPNSGPILSKSKPNIIRFYSRKSCEEDENYRRGGGKKKGDKMIRTVFHSAGPETVGGSGLALRYANVILLAEEYLEPAASVGRCERDSLYGMLPENVKDIVRTKLSKKMNRMRENDVSLAAGWRDAMEELMTWLAPMARDTAKWHRERNLVEKMELKFDSSVVLIQTLHFSDREKTEAAIAELLVGLSCVFLYENRRLGE